MLAIFSEFDGMAFAADALDIDSILPASALAGGNGVFAEFLTYKGVKVFAADFCRAAAGRAARPIYSARGIVFKLPQGGFFGLVAEGVIQAEEIDESHIEYYPCACGGLSFAKAFREGERMVKLIEPAKLYAELCAKNLIGRGGDEA